MFNQEIGFSARYPNRMTNLFSLFRQHDYGLVFFILKTIVSLRLKQTRYYFINALKTEDESVPLNIQNRGNDNKII